MDDTVNKLEAMFNKAESEIDYVTRKVDAECANITEGGTNVNPAEVIQWLKDVKKEYANIVTETQAIQEAQKEAVSYLRDQLTGLCSSMMKLQQQPNLIQSEAGPDLQQLESLLGVTLAPGPTEVSSGEAVGQCTPPQPTTGQNSAGQTDTAQTHTGQTSAQTALQLPPGSCVLSASDRRLQSPDFLELEEQEFQSVSSLVRGKVKLSEVNHTYRVLWHHFKEENNSEALTTGDMHKMGLRVTGHTGEAKLKVLRALKLLTISRKGDVMLV